VFGGAADEIGADALVAAWISDVGIANSLARPAGVIRPIAGNSAARAMR
jgi:hypothetical protein